MKKYATATSLIGKCNFLKASVIYSVYPLTLKPYANNAYADKSYFVSQFGQMVSYFS